MRKGFVVAMVLVTLAIFLGYSASADAQTKQRKLIVKNMQSTVVTASINFGADSKITAADLGSFCKSSAHKLNCRFDVPPNGGSKEIPNPSYKYVNFAVAFKSDVGCGSTKAEGTINNPSWYDVMDVSLVDGFNEKVSMRITPAGGKTVVLGPPVGKTGNEKVFGVFPLGCDVCAEKRNPPCGISKGKDGCKGGTEYKPDVICQYQENATAGTVEIVLEK